MMFHDHPTLFVSWRSPKTRLIHPVGRLTNDPVTHRYAFNYIHGVRKAQVDGFLPFAEFPRLDSMYLSRELFPLFANRVMPASRPGYPSFLAALGLSPDAAEPMAILARTGGSRQTDQIELFPSPVLDGPADCYITHCLLRAVRYMHVPTAEEGIARLASGDRLYVMADFQNEVDPSAMAVRTADNVFIGYLPAYLTCDLRSLNDQCSSLTVSVERVNPPPAEVQHRLLCKIVSCWPKGFRPFAGDDFQAYSSASPG